MHGNSAHRQRVTYIDVVLLVAQEEVVHDGSFMQLCQRGHVLYSMDAARVHRVHRLPVELCLLQVDHLEQHRSGFLGYKFQAEFQALVEQLPN